MSRKHLWIIAATVLAVIIISTSAYLFIHAYQSENNNNQAIPRELLKLYVLSALYLDKTSNSLYHSVYGLPSTPSITVKDIENLLKQYREDEKFLPLVPVTGLDKLLIGTYNTYRDIAIVAGHIIRINKRTSQLLPEMKKSLKNLVNCNYTGAMKIYNTIKDEINSLSSEIGNALLNLTSINKEYILSPKHMETINKTITLLQQLENILDKYTYIMNTFQNNPSILQKACMISSGKHPSLNQQLIQQASNLLNQMNNSQMAALEPYKDALQALIGSILSQAMNNGNNGQNNGSQSNTSGNGAGSYNYTETD
ncbi:MAG: hypothetical protein GXO43_05515 [Crenarchaeota archaeon]|nr:hypothetical protein [Thermoproteota archaeon]